jgi:riboflavin kinase/FMN adenylyltransferase
MQLILGIHNLESIKTTLQNGSVLTIGNFDGVHLGHQQVLQTVVAQAKKQRLPSVVMLFEPLPIEYFSPDNAPVRLMNFREKIKALQGHGIDYVLCVRFNRWFASLSAAQFVQTILVNALKVKHLVVGDDFRFGQQRQGDFSYLKQAGETLNFSVTDMPTFDVAGKRVSSTRVRLALESPDLMEAKALLGKPFHFNGRVIHGKKLGRTLGFRTLNLNPKRIQMPVQGVFAVTVGGLAKSEWPGVANIGLRPTVDGVRPSIEVHLFNWSKEVYGSHISVTLQHFIRPEQKFNGIEALKTQIALDVQKTKHFFKL